MSSLLETLLNPARLAALRRLGLWESPPEAAFDRLGALAVQILHTPVALVSLVGDTRQFFKSCIGLPEPWATWRETPLSHSICQHVVASSAPLIINDARVDPLFQHHPAIRDLGVVAYLGIPLRLQTGEVLGSFCVIDSKPRIWKAEEERIMQALTDCVITEIELRSEILHRQAAAEEVRKLNDELRLKASALEKANADLESFNYSVTHDLRNPLRILNVFSGLLLESAGRAWSGECENYVQSIRATGKKMSRVLDGLLLLNQIGQSGLCREQVDLSECTSGILADRRQTHPERRVEVIIEPGMVVSADRRLVQVLLENLLDNAWKFTAKQPLARIEFGSKKLNNSRIFFVRDNGAGFDMDLAHKLSIPFHRLHSEREFEGAGIGLGTVQKIIQRHQGRVWWEGKVNVGATFYFTLAPEEP